MTTRREFLGGIGAAAALAVTGVPTVAVSDSAPAIKPLPAWDVGSSEFDWRVIFAETKEEAQKIWYADAHGHDADDPCACGCGAADAYCEKYGEGLPEARRAKHWDNPDNEEPFTEDLYRAGWSTHCDRCANEINREDGESDVIDHKCVCHDCMTDDELRAVYPDHRRFDVDDEELAEA